MEPKLGKDLASLATAPLHFARWERARHRAKTYALIFFPDRHPFRQAVDTVCNGLETVRYEAEVCLQTVVREHGAFRGIINGFFFESPENNLFKGDAQRYHDCPEYTFGKGIKREKMLPLAGMGSIHVLEACGRSFITAASRLAEATAPRWKRRLNHTAKVILIAGGSTDSSNVLKWIQLRRPTRCYVYCGLASQRKAPASCSVSSKSERQRGDRVRQPSGNGEPVHLFCCTVRPRPRGRCTAENKACDDNVERRRDIDSAWATAGHKYVGGLLMHSKSGAPFDPDLHAALAHAKKLACLKTHYWERGGRAKRLQRYTQKRVRRHTQLTLAEVTAQLAQGWATRHAEELSALAARSLTHTESESRTSYTCPRLTYEPVGA